jgi:hypothetical protein
MTPFQVEELLVTVVPYEAACNVRNSCVGKTACITPGSKNPCNDPPTCQARSKPCAPGGSRICFEPTKGKGCNVPKTPPAPPRKKAPARPPAKKKAPARAPAKKKRAAVFDDLHALQAQLRARLESGSAPN